MDVGNCEVQIDVWGAQEVRGVRKVVKYQGWERAMDEIGIGKLLSH